MQQKKKGSFQHSSFLAGGATSAAGRLVAENGILKVGKGVPAQYILIQEMNIMRKLLKSSFYNYLFRLSGHIAAIIVPRKRTSRSS
jgi:hypothetical protein